MSAIYTYGQWIDIVDRGTSGDQVMDILASWKVDAYKLLEDNHKLEAELAHRDEVIRKLKEDGERLFSGLKDFDGTRGWKICKFCHAEMEFVDHSTDCPITLHRALMKELAEC